LSHSILDLCRFIPIKRSPSGTQIWQIVSCHVGPFFGKKSPFQVVPIGNTNLATCPPHVGPCQYIPISSGPHQDHNFSNLSPSMLGLSGAACATHPGGQAAASGVDLLLRVRLPCHGDVRWQVVK
jgi:hypothetical protein